MRILRIFCNEKISHNSDSDHEIDSVYRLHTSEYFAATQIICKHEKTCTTYPRIFSVFLWVNTSVGNKPISILTDLYISTRSVKIQRKMIFESRMIYSIALYSCFTIWSKFMFYYLLYSSFSTGSWNQIVLHKTIHGFHQPNMYCYRSLPWTWNETLVGYTINWSPVRCAKNLT